jgi:AAA+ ATPase superfamily predicted ATPase
VTNFIGREQDLNTIRRELDVPQPSLVIVYGRRRIGKSTLLQHASKGRAAVYFQATRLEEALNLAALKGDIAQALGADPELDDISDWLGLFHHLARRAEKQPGLVVVLDEFPYLTDGNPALPSVIQKFWDSGAPKRGHLKLVLCGSTISQMEELLSERNPLYGRRTLSLEMKAMPLREASEFLPDWQPVDRIIAYSIFGGVPYYLSLCDPTRPLAANVERLFLAKSAPLQEEPDFLLQSELRETRRYSSIVAAIASGATKPSDIIGRVPGLKDGAQLFPYMDRLMHMGIVQRARSLDANENSRDSRYFVSDPLFRFWHIFVRPNLSALSRGFGRDVWQRRIVPNLPTYMGLAFEEVCREHVRSYAQERLGVPASEVGSIWGKDFEIDVAGVLLDGAVFFGECKWENAFVGESIRDSVLKSAARTSYGADAGVRHTLLFAKKGFAEGLRRLAQIDGSIHLFNLDDLVHAPKSGTAQRR